MTLFPLDLHLLYIWACVCNIWNFYPILHSCLSILCLFTVLSWQYWKCTLGQHRPTQDRCLYMLCRVAGENSKTKNTHFVDFFLRIQSHRFVVEFDQIGRQSNRWSNRAKLSYCFRVSMTSVVPSQSEPCDESALYWRTKLLRTSSFDHPSFRPSTSDLHHRTLRKKKTSAKVQWVD